MRKPWERGVYSVGICPPLPHRTNLRSDKKSRILDCEDVGFSNARWGCDNGLLLLHDNGGYTVELVHPARYQENINDEQDAQNYKRNYPDKKPNSCPASKE